MDEKREKAVRASLKKDIWLMSSIIGTSATFFLALLSSSSKIESSDFLLLSAILFAIELPVSVAILSICLSVEWDIENSLLIPLYNSPVYNYSSIIPVVLVPLSIMFLLLHLSTVVGVVFTLTVIFVILIFKKANKDINS